MTTEEFSNEFDTLLNSNSTNNISDIKLDEYEKSIFLTKAQEEVVISMYNGKNPFGDSFERTEEIRRYLSNLIKTEIISDKVSDQNGLSKSSVFFQLPEDLWFITYESLNINDDLLGCKNKEGVSVTPITQDEYHKLKNNPFRNSNERKALRLDSSNSIVEIISKYNIESYLVRYIARPAPIILQPLTGGLSVNGETKKTECELNPVLHRTILEKAVELALRSKVPNMGK